MRPPSPMPTAAWKVAGKGLLLLLVFLLPGGSLLLLGLTSWRALSSAQERKAPERSVA